MYGSKLQTSGASNEANRKGRGVAGRAVVIVANAKISVPVVTEFSTYFGGKIIDVGAGGLFARDQRGRLLCGRGTD